MKTKKKPFRIIEDRTKRDPKYSFAGYYVVFEKASHPFAHNVFCGAFKTLEEAKKAQKS